ncbi:MAG: hypothetical protein BWX63_00153 [Bacteroidetes bacterium ADurb.Bin041]|nr:MAG: hypothetical protein BWX63_00153 [Bacteroidetes bacterium ADurb.Bin041]
MSYVPGQKVNVRKTNLNFRYAKNTIFVSNSYNN